MHVFLGRVELCNSLITFIEENNIYLVKWNMLICIEYD